MGAKMWRISAQLTLKTKGGAYYLFSIKVKSRSYFSGRNAKPGVLFKKSESDADARRILALVPDQHAGNRQTFQSCASIKRN